MPYYRFQISGYVDIDAINAIEASKIAHNGNGHDKPTVNAENNAFFAQDFATQADANRWITLVSDQIQRGKIAQHVRITVDRRPA